MAFFRTTGTERDPSIANGAQSKRREQLQVQLQMQAAQKADLAAAETPQPMGAGE